MSNVYWFDQWSDHFSYSINLIIDIRAQIMYRKELDRWTFCGPNMYLQWLGYCLQGQLVVINIQTRGKRKWHYLNLLSSYLAFLSTMTTLTLHQINLTTQDRASNTGTITSCHQIDDTVGCGVSQCVPGCIDNDLQPHRVTMSPSQPVTKLPWDHVLSIWPRAHLYLLSPHIQIIIWEFQGICYQRKRFEIPRLPTTEILYWFTDRI